MLRTGRVISKICVCVVALLLANGVQASCEGVKESVIDGSESDAPEVLYERGRHYEYGICVTRNDSTAIHWYSKAAEQGIAEAQYRLGVLYDNGWGSDVNAKLALKYYRMAAEQNYALAQHDLALMYHNAKGVKKDNVAAYQWIYIAVSQGNEIMREQMLRISEEMSEQEIATAREQAISWQSESI